MPALRTRFLPPETEHAILSIAVFGDGVDHLSYDPAGADLPLGSARTHSCKPEILSMTRVMQPAHLLNPPHPAHTIARMTDLPWPHLVFATSLAPSSPSFQQITRQQQRSCLIRQQ
jgi:hypothetical protein